MIKKCQQLPIHYSLIRQIMKLLKHNFIQYKLSTFALKYVYLYIWYGINATLLFKKIPC